MGIKVIRFENKQVFEYVAWVIEKLKRSLTTPDFMLRIKSVPSLKKEGKPLSRSLSLHKPINHIVYKCVIGKQQ